jgi:hypothetical protein
LNHCWRPTGLFGRYCGIAGGFPAYQLRLLIPSNGRKLGVEQGLQQKQGSCNVRLSDTAWYRFKSETVKQRDVEAAGTVLFLEIANLDFSQ